MIIYGNSLSGNRDCGIDFEPCSKLEDLNLNVRKNAEDMEERYPMEALSARLIFTSKLT